MTVEAAGDGGDAKAAQPSGSRMLLGLLGAVAADAVILLAGPQTVAAIVFAPFMGIPMILLMFVAVGFATAGILRLATGMWRALPGVLAGVAALAACIALFSQTPTVPMTWIPTLGIDIGFVPAAPISAAAAALALPRWWVRVLGGALVLLAGAMLLGPAIVAASERRAAEEEAERRAAVELFERRLDGPRPVTTDWVGAHRVDDTSFYLTEGGALQIDVYDLPQGSRDEFACWILTPGMSSFDETVTMDDFAGVCGPRGDARWERADGSVIALVLDGRLVTVGPPPRERLVELGVDRAATAAEITAAAEQLRPLTRDEYRAELLREQERWARLGEPD